MTKKEIIIEKAIELFSKNSIANTSIQDITDACGISKGAFYLSFRSKDDLLIEIIDQFIKELTVSFELLMNDPRPPRQKLEKFCDSTLRVFNERFPLLEMLITESSKSLKTELLERIQIFNRNLNDITLFLLENTYGAKIEKNKYDLQLCFKGIVQSYIDFIIHHKNDLEFKKISHMIMQYMDALVEQQFEPTLDASVFASQFSCAPEPQAIQQIISNEIKRCKKLYSADHFYGQTILAIEKEMIKDNPQLVILNALATNLMSEKELRWLATLVRRLYPKPTT